jgi:hypothetical protein
MRVAFPDEPPHVNYGNRSVEFVATVDDGERIVNRVPIEVLNDLAKRDAPGTPSVHERTEVLALFDRYQDELRDLARRAIEEGRTNALGGADLVLLL